MPTLPTDRTNNDTAVEHLSDHNELAAFHNTHPTNPAAHSGTYVAFTDVTKYGAVGDGSTDDSAAIASALAVVNASGGTLYFPAGKTFKCPAIVNVTHADVTVWGYGATLDIPTDHSGTGRYLGFTGAARPKVLGLRLTCSNAASRTQLYGMLSFFNCTDAKVRDVTIASGEGIALYTEQLVGFSFEGIYVTNTWADGIHLSRGSTDGNVTGCTASNVRDDSFVVASITNDGATNYVTCARIAITGCTVVGPIVAGGSFVNNGGTDVTFESCVSKSAFSQGFVAATKGAGWFDAVRTLFVGCIADAPTGKAYHVATATDTVFSACASTGGTDGIAVIGGIRTLISGCRARGASGYGIYSDAASTYTHHVGCDLAGNTTGTSLLQEATSTGVTADLTASTTGTQTLTNKTISGASNTLSSIAQSAITSLVSDLAAKAADSAVVKLTTNQTVAGNKTFSGHIDTSGSVPSIAAGAQAGSGATATVLQGNDNRGLIRVSTGTGAAAGQFCVVTFGSAHGASEPSVMLMPVNAPSLADGLVVASNATTFTVTTINTPASSTDHYFHYMVMG